MRASEHGGDEMSAEGPPTNVDREVDFGDPPREPATAVLLVEGEGDAISLRLACELAGVAWMLADIEIRPLGGTTNHLAMSVSKYHSEKGQWRLLALLDHDDKGREAQKRLKGDYHYRKEQVISYADVLPPAKGSQFPYEAEDLWHPDLIAEFARRNTHEGSRRRPDGHYHYDFDKEQKRQLEPYLREHARSEHCAKWIEMVALIRERLGLVATFGSEEGNAPGRGPKAGPTARTHPPRGAIADGSDEVSSDPELPTVEAELPVDEGLLELLRASIEAVIAEKSEIEEDHRVDSERRAIKNAPELGRSPRAATAASRVQPIARTSGDDYDDATRWSFNELKKLATARGHRFRRGAKRGTVISRLRQQDREGWVPGKPTRRGEATSHTIQRSTPKLPTHSRDNYDDKSAWPYMDLRWLAIKRGHSFGRGADRALVIRRLRRQDADGWIPGALERRPGG